MPGYLDSDSARYADSVEDAVYKLTRLANTIRTDKQDVFRKMAASGGQGFQQILTAGNAEIDALEKQAQSWTDDYLRGLHRAQYSAGSGGIPTLTKRDRDEFYRTRNKLRKNTQATVAEMRRSFKEDVKSAVGNTQAKFLSRGILSDNDMGRKSQQLSKAEFTKLRTEQEALKAQVKKLQSSGENRQSLYTIKYKGRKVKGKRSAPVERSVASHAAMYAQTGHNRMYNMGFLQGLTRAGVEYVRVIDGADCGWTYHDDPDRANGKVVKVQDAIPLAHPACQRQFDRATDEDIKNATKKAGQKLADILSKNEKTAVKAATAAAAALAATTLLTQTGIGPAAVNAAVTRLGGPGGLGASMARLLPRWREMVIRERFNTEFQRLIQVEFPEGVKVPEPVMAGGQEEAARRQILARMDDIVTADTFDPPPWMKQLIGADATDKEAFMEAVGDYADYAEFTNGLQRDAWDNLQLAKLAQDGVKEFNDALPIIGDFRYHLASPRGLDLNGVASGITRVLERFYHDPLSPKVPLETLKAIVTAIDPFPWFRASLGKFRFSLGLSADGRRDLATKIYKYMKSVDKSGEGFTFFKFSEEDLAFAKANGIDLQEWTKKITYRDIYEALIPRVTFNPGGVFSATVASVNGRISPVIRALPQGGYTKWLRFESRLRSGAVERALKMRREGKPLDEIAQQFGSDISSHLSFFRNGPVASHIRFYGTQLDGYGVRLRSTANIFKDTFLGQRVTEPARKWEIPNIIDDEIERDEGGNVVFRTVQVPAYTYTKFLNELVILPSRALSMGVNSNDAIIQSVFTRLHMVTGSIGHVSRTLRIPVGQGVDIYKAAQQRFGKWNSLSMNEIRSISNLADLRDFVLKLPTVGEQARYELVDAVDDVSILGANEPDPRFKKISGQVEQWFNGMRIPPPTIVQWDELPNGWSAAYYPGEQVIRVDSRYVEDVSKLSAIRQRKVTTGFYPVGTEAAAGSVWHEVGHHLAMSMPLDRYKFLWTTIIRNQEDYHMGFSPREKYRSLVQEAKSRDAVDAAVNLWMTHGRDYSNKIKYPEGYMQRQLRRKISGYGASNPAELLAEAFSEYMVSRTPRPFSEFIGTLLAKQWEA
jgi:hypothetical protein